MKQFSQLNETKPNQQRYGILAARHVLSVLQVKATVFIPLLPVRSCLPDSALLEVSGLLRRSEGRFCWNSYSDTNRDSGTNPLNSSPSKSHGWSRWPWPTAPLGMLLLNSRLWVRRSVPTLAGSSTSPTDARGRTQNINAAVGMKQGVPPQQTCLGVAQMDWHHLAGFFVLLRKLDEVLEHKTQMIICSELSN